MAAEEGKKPLARSVESLGWLASSGVQPRKRREIEGARVSRRPAAKLGRRLPPLLLPCSLSSCTVFLAITTSVRRCRPPPLRSAGVGAASLMALQAQVAKAQQEASLVREGKLDAEELRARWGAQLCVCMCVCVDGVLGTASMLCCGRGRWAAGSGAFAARPTPCLPAAPPRRRKGSMATLLERKNAGVGDRDQRDRLALKARWAASMRGQPGGQPPGRFDHHDSRH